MEDEGLMLGDKINLIGFRSLSRAEMVVVKKIVGNYVRKFMERDAQFSRLTLHVKPVHEIDDNKKYAIKATLEGSNALHTEAEDKNLFVCLDSVLKKLEASQ